MRNLPSSFLSRQQHHPLSASSSSSYHHQRGLSSNSTSAFLPSLRIIVTYVGSIILITYLLSCLRVHTDVSQPDDLTQRLLFRGGGEGYLGSAAAAGGGGSLDTHIERERDDLRLFDVRASLSSSSSSIRTLPREEKKAKDWTIRNSAGTSRCQHIINREWKIVPCGRSNQPSEKDEEDIQWCRETQQRAGVQVGRSWGSLGGQGKEKWENVGCNGIIALGRKQTCDEMSGLSYIEDWRQNMKMVLGDSLTTTSSSTAAREDQSLAQEGEEVLAVERRGLEEEERKRRTSRIVCTTNYVQSEACMLENVVVDFGKAQPRGGATRDAEDGFVLLDDEEGGGGMKGKMPNFPKGIQMRPGALKGCEEWVEEVTMVMSHDDIYNFGHSLADFWVVFLMGQLFNWSWSKMRMINMDGIRGNGPAGNGNRMMVQGQPDTFSAFFDLYRSWFGKGVTKAIDYGTKKVCFKQIFFQPEPGPAHVWADFSRINPCSLQGPSWLYQEYNRHIRQHLFTTNSGIFDSREEEAETKKREGGGEGKEGQIVDFRHLPRPERPQVTFLIRNLKPGTYGGKVGSSRIVANQEEFLSELQSIPGIDVVAQDFSTVSFMDQIRIIQNTSVLIGMHGAGMAHITSLPVGSPRCCSVVELTVEGFHHLNQFGNIARHLGLTFHRWEAHDQGKNTPQGTLVDAKAIRSLVEEALATLPP